MNLQNTTSMSHETRHGVTRWLLKEAFGTVFVAAILFGTAGTIRWTAGWVMVAVYVIWISANAYLIIPTHPELLAERAKRRPEGVKSWDMRLLGVFGIMVLLKYFLAAFDFRLGWSGSMALWIQGLGLLLATVGYGLVTWGMVSNAFFATEVRLQPDRGQTVIKDGPYQFIRHPGYLGAILFEVGSSLLLGSWWALLPGLVSAVVMTIRTKWEDETLQEELPGYRAFTVETRYRLIPGVW